MKSAEAMRLKTIKMNKERNLNIIIIVLQVLVIAALTLAFFIENDSIKNPVRLAAYILLIVLLILRIFKPSILKKKQEG